MCMTWRGTWCPQVAPDASLDDVSSLMLRNPGDLVLW